MIFILAHDTARQRALEAVKTATDGYVIEVREPKRTRDQNDKLHALLSEIGEKIEWHWNGFKIDTDDLKSIFVAAYRKTKGQNVRLLPGIDGEPVLMSWRTRDMPKSEMCDLITMIEAWQAQTLTPTHPQDAALARRQCAGAQHAAQTAHDAPTATA